MTEQARSETHAWVSEYYGKLLASTADLKTNACCASGAPPAWIAGALQRVHPEVLNRFYGCGFPIPHAVDGATVVDLGCGTGRDAYVLAQLVGASGQVIGVDMTEEQLQVARDTEQWHADAFGFGSVNTSFRHGFIEDLRAAGIEDEGVDVIVSNCVVNLSPRKDLVLAEAWRALKPGGEMYFSDVFVDRRLAPEVASDPVLYGECLGGALYRPDFESLAKRTGFLDPRVTERSVITIGSDEVAAKVGAAQFESVTYRLIKLEGLDEHCEDYGQTATYRGGILGAEALVWFDEKHAFERGRPERVCRNTAAMLARSRFGAFFDIGGDATTHFGAHPCTPTMAALAYRNSGGGAAAPAPVMSAFSPVSTASAAPASSGCCG
jgi:ubiquinone/menaquinone biosynthesis C-methylase UbiE